ncbi:zinc-dependent alcohol dehydrogenase [Rhodovibrio salinarum]|uniref:Alcohol dehydrogenase n=1 Tax=Rhodovibrio salinarum TaxID=1087 RepID=A0A934QG77_9PROT|nr:alcohol dehydrogenase catalytic domain-containing protein [Rhodovibrio salinarum]MBK1696412.1 alcohol dehydrogenase [Rhodovibrio salinarum]
MQAAYLHGARDIRLGTWEPAPRHAGDVPIAVACVGVCGSDLHYYKEGGIGAARVTEPFIMGHEFAGHLEQDVPQAGLKAGQLVAVDPARPCGVCEHCLRAHVNLCPHVVFMGAPPNPGGLAQTVYAGVEQLYPLPDGFGAVEAAMLEPLGVGVHAMDLAKPQLLETVTVVGCGPIGLMLLQLARHAGVGRIYAVDPVDYRAEAARQHGADAVAAHVDAIADLTDGRGTDLVLEATNSPDGAQHAVDAARIGGRILLVGIPDGDRYNLTAASARRKGLEIKFARRMGHVYPRAIQLVAEGRVDVTRMVTHEVALQETADAFRLMADHADGAIKAVVMPNR